MDSNKQYTPFLRFFANLSVYKAVFLIALLGFIVYGNALFNDFVWDDIFFILFNPDVQHINIAHLFSGNLFNSSGYYRPIPALYFALLYAVSGSHAFFYHFLQVLLHILNTVLVFILFRYLLKAIKAKDANNTQKQLQNLSGSQRVKYLRMHRQAEKATDTPDAETNILSLFLSLVFLVHPINVESVSFILASTNELCFLSGILALLFSLKKKISMKYMFLIGCLTLLSLLSKEVGILFLLMIVCYRFLFNRKGLFIFFIADVVLLTIYFFFRIAIGNVFFSKREGIVPVPIADVSFTQRLANIPVIVFHYILTVFYPARLVIGQNWIVTRITAENFYLPLLIDSAFFITMCIGGAYIFYRRRVYFTTYLMFFFWFLASLFMLLQLFPLDYTVADRWFYFPLIGLLGLLGIGIQTVLFPPDRNYASHTMYQRIKTSAAVFGTILILLLSLRTIVRNTNFRNQITLYSHDAQLEENFALEDDLGVDYYEAGNTQAALPHLLKSVKLRPFARNLFHLGVFYDESGDIQKAKRFYSRSLTFYDAFYASSGAGSWLRKGDLKVYVKLVRSFVLTKEYDACLKTGRQGLQYFPDSYQLWGELTVCDAKLQRWDDALAAAQKVKTINPDNYSNFLYKGIQQKIDIPDRDNPNILKGIGAN